MTEHLRPVERRVLAMAAEGVSTEEIARRFKRSPSHVERIMSWARIPRTGPPSRKAVHAMQRRVLQMRSAGMSYSDIGQRFRRSPRFIRQVEGLAHYQKAMQLLG